MSRYTGRGAQRLIQGHVGFVSVAALLCLSGTARLAAQAPETIQQAPATQQTPATQQAPAQPAPAPAETATPTTTPSTEPSTPSTTPDAATTTPTPASPSGGGVTLPTVQVEATQPRAPRRVAPQITAPAAPLPTPAAPAVAAGPTDGYQATQSGITRMPVPLRIRTDVSATLFISGPEDYDGGELVVEDTYGRHAVKLPAGDMIVYPGTSLHHVTPITRGARIASFFWVQSMIRDVTQRGLLFDLDMAIVRLNRDHPDHPSIVQLTSIYHNLLRQWSEL